MTIDAHKVAMDLVDARRHSLDAALARAPSASGIYAWWSIDPDIGGVPGTMHADGYLYYVGIANRTARSLRTRLHDHIRKTTRRSTERVTLAALLGPGRGWTTMSVAMGKTHPARYRTVLANPFHERALSQWMADHLRVSWVELPDPGDVEGGVISFLRPPLNLAKNTAHPSYPIVRAARSAFNRSSDAVP